MSLADAYLRAGSQVPPIPPVTGGGQPGATHGPSPDLAPFLERLVAFTNRFVSFSSVHQATAVALWVAHVYAIDAAHAAAYLRVTSAAEESGKTTLLEILEAELGGRGINAVSVSPAVLFRLRDKRGPVALLLDEIDNTLRDRRDDGARDLLALVNAGYRRSATVLRVTGPNHEPKEFAAFGPAVISGLGSLHPTTESRCIPIVLERKLRGSGERWLRFKVEDEIEALTSALASWASEETIARLRRAEPPIPVELRDRHAEAWWGLFAIADEAGEGWPAKARDAAVTLHASRDQETVGLGVLLLRHCRQAFEEAGQDRLATQALLNHLVQNEEGPWGRFWGQELNRDGSPRGAATDLAHKLRPFGPKPKVIRIGGDTHRGYALEDFATAFGQYLDLPADTPVTDVTPVTVLASDVTPVTGVTGGAHEAEAQVVDAVKAMFGAEIEPLPPMADGQSS